MPKASAPSVRRIKPGTKLISIGTQLLMTKANYQEFQRFQSVDVPISGDVEATLPSLIEAVKSALTADRKNALAQRGDAIRKDHDKGRDGARQAAAIAWDASPISTARLCMELYAQIKDFDWSLVPSSGDVSGWPLRLWAMNKPYHWTGTSGGYGVGWGAPASVGGALANRDEGRFSVAIQSDGDLMYAPGALWTAARHKIPMLSVMHNNRGYHQEVMHVQRLSNFRNRARQYRRRSGPDRHQHHESRYRVPQARRVHGLVGQGSDQGSRRARPGDQGSDRRGQIRPAGAGQCLDPTAVRKF